MNGRTTCRRATMAREAADALAIHGCRPVCDNAGRQPWPVFDETERRNLLAVLDNGQWWYGAWVREFEQAFARFQALALASPVPTARAAHGPGFTPTAAMKT